MPATTMLKKGVCAQELLRIILVGLLVSLGAVQAKHLILPNVPMHARGARPGWSIGNRTCAPQTLDVFLGPFCEDSRALWPTMKLLAEVRGAATAVRVHLFPLPYNLGSWLPAQACAAAATLQGNSSSTFVECLSLLYAGDHQKRIKTLAMVNGTTADVIAALVELFAASLGINSNVLTANLQQGLESGAPSYTKAKLSLKYGYSHGVFATPSVLLNGVQIFGYDNTLEGLHAEGEFPELTVGDWVHLLTLQT